MIFVIDNSIYKKNANHDLYKTLKRYDIKFLIIKNVRKLIEYLKDYKPTYFILSGSPLMFSETDIFVYREQFRLNALIIYLFAKQIPILGICFGAEFIISYFGGKLEKLKEEYCGFWRNTDLYFCTNYIIKDLPPKFDSIMKLEQLGTILFSSTEYNIHGFMFHPEKHENTLFVIKEFLKITPD